MDSQNRRRARPERKKRRRTTWNGWRMVAGGALLIIFGFSFITNDFGPIWFGGAMIVAGVGLAIYGRRH